MHVCPCLHAERVPASEERPKRQAGRAALARLQQVQEEEEGEGGDTDTGVNDGDISPLPATQPLASQPAADAASKGAARSKRVSDKEQHPLVTSQALSVPGSHVYARA